MFKANSVLMIVVYLLIMCLAAAFTYIVILWLSSNAFKSRSLILEKDIAISLDEIIKLNSLNLKQINYLLEKETIIKGLKTKYGPIINLEEIIEVRTSDFKAILNSLEDLNVKYIYSLDIYNSLEREIKLYASDLDMIGFGLYKPQYDFVTSEEYKQKIELNYIKQKECLITDKATIYAIDMTITDNKREDKTLINTYKKLMLFAFNGECDALISKLKWNTATKTIEKLNKSYENINKLGSAKKIEISEAFFKLKYSEIALTHEYENKKQQERDEHRRVVESMREEEKALRDFKIALKDAEEDERRYQKALIRVKEDLRYASKEEMELLNEKIGELEVKLKEAEIKKDRAISMAQQTKAGHIYIISNIGSFGENVYKIGMTRRLEPLERVKELSDAALPFKYDVHAVIFSENAPQLERELHNEFDDQRINRVNGRKEFFNVTLDQIEQYVKSSNEAEINFTFLAEAKEYRETLSIMESELKLEEGSQFSQLPKFPKSLLS